MTVLYLSRFLGYLPRSGVNVSKTRVRGWLIASLTPSDSPVHQNVIPICTSINQWLWQCCLFTAHLPQVWVIKKKKKWFIFVLSHHCCGQAFPGCGKWGGYSLVAVWGLLIAEASLVVAHGLQGARALVVVARGLHSCGSQDLEHRLDSYGTQTLLLWGTWDFLRPGMEPIVSCIGRWILYHWATRETLLWCLIHR